MFRSRRIVLDTSYEETLRCLKGQIRHSFPMDNVKEDSFSIHRSITNSPGSTSGFTNFKFSGTIRKIGEQTEIKYRVMPPILLLFVFTFLFAFVVVSVFQLLFSGGSIITLILILLFCSALYGFSAWECSECVKFFESKLK